MLFPIWFGISTTWYVSCYIIFCCFIPFLNPFLNGLGKKQYQTLLIVSILIWSVAYTFKGSNFLGADFSIDHFIVIYALGGYIRKFGIHLKRFSWRMIFAVSTFLLVLSVVAISYGSYRLGNDTLLSYSTYFSKATNILDVIIGLSLFMWVIESKPFYSRAVNTAAKSVVGVYLIHQNLYLKQVIWGKISPNTDYLHSNYLPLHCFIKVVCVFAICLAIDQLRLLTVDKAFRKFLDKKWDKLSKIPNALLKKMKRILPFE